MFQEYLGLEGNLNIDCREARGRFKKMEKILVDRDKRRDPEMVLCRLYAFRAYGGGET